MDKQEQNAAGEKKGNIEWKQWTLLCLLCTQSFTSDCLISVMYPVYPNQASKVGMSITVVGLVFGFYAFVIFISSPFLGKLIPRVGTKFMFIGGLVINGCSTLLFGTVEQLESYTSFATASFLLRGLEALGASASVTATYGIIADVYREHDSFARGIVEVFNGIGMCVGPALGSFLYAVGGFGLPLYVLGIITLLIILPSILLIPQSHEYNEEKGASSYGELLKLPKVIGEVFNLLAIGICWSSLEPWVEPYLRSQNLDPMEIGGVFVVSSVFYAGASPLWGYLSDRPRYHWMIPTGTFGMAACFFVLGVLPMFVPSCIWSDIAAIAIQDAFMVMALIPSYRALFDNARNNGFEDNAATHGVVTGLWLSVYFLSEVIGPVMGGYLAENIGFHYANTVFTVILLVSGIISLFTSVPRIPSQVKPDNKI